MTKFSSDEYLNGDSLTAEYQGNISICGNVITFSGLEFDEEVKININSLVLCKDKIYDAVDRDISIFFGKNDDDTTYKVNFDTLNYEFSGCIFNKNVHINPAENNDIAFDYCTFKEHFYINHDEQNLKKVNVIEIRDTTFERDFTVYNAEINSIKIKNVDFESLSEFNEVTFQEKFDLQEITYKGFTLFDRCIFNTKAEFEYIIFEKFASFRGTIFNKGLSLDFTSTDNEINFFEIKGLGNNESKKNTSQETYRIIKYQLQKVGNIIGANKYHSLELSKRRQQLPFYRFDYLILFFHWITSNHSQNWILPLFWIFVVGFMTCWGLADFGYGYCSYKVSDIFKYISIVNFDDCIKKDPMIFVLNKVFLGYLYYQFLTAVRKDTRK